MSQTFLKGELEKEIRDPNHPGRLKWIMKADGDIAEMMEKILEEQSQIVYEHQQTPNCLVRGLSYLDVCPRCAEHCVLAEELNYPNDIKRYEKSSKHAGDCGHVKCGFRQFMKQSWNSKTGVY